MGLVILSMIAKVLLGAGIALWLIYAGERGRFNLRDRVGNVEFTSVPQIERTWLDHPCFRWGLVLIMLSATILFVTMNPPR